MALQINDHHLIGFQFLRHNFNGNIWTTYTFALRLFVILREIKDSEKHISFYHSGLKGPYFVFIYPYLLGHYLKLTFYPSDFRTFSQKRLFIMAYFVFTPHYWDIDTFYPRLSGHLSQNVSLIHPSLTGHYLKMFHSKLRQSASVTSEAVEVIHEKTLLS